MTPPAFRTDAGLAGKGVVVTGAARGIGRATAQLFAASGARVCAVDRDADGLGELLAGLAEPGRHRAETVDLVDVTSHEAIIARTAEAFGRVDALVHAAAVLRRAADVRSVTEHDWDLQHDVNLKACFFLARAAAEAMRADGGGGRIVCFSSQGWWTGGYGGSIAYSASKGGVVSLVRGLARTYGPHGICVNAIAPGLVDTPMLRGDISDEDLAALVQATPLRRLAEPQEVAAAAVFLTCEHASFISGATLNVSGGFLMY